MSMSVLLSGARGLDIWGPCPRRKAPWGHGHSTSSNAGSRPAGLRVQHSYRKGSYLPLCFCGSLAVSAHAIFLTCTGSAKVGTSPKWYCPCRSQICISPVDGLRPRNATSSFHLRNGSPKNAKIKKTNARFGACQSYLHFFVYRISLLLFNVYT